MNDLELMERATELIDLSNANNLLVRLLGGCAIYSKYASLMNERRIARRINDIDLVVRRKDLESFLRIITSMGFEPSQQFNYLFGTKRRLYKRDGIVVDMFVDNIEMNSLIELPVERLKSGLYTIPVTEMLLEKLQMRDDKENKYIDLALIIFSEKILDDHSDGDGISLPIINDYFRSNWPMFHVGIENLYRFGSHLDRNFPDKFTNAEVDRVHDAVSHMISYLKKTPKTLNWHFRNLFGEKLVWYKNISQVDPWLLK